MVDVVAKALCEEAGKSVNGEVCTCCDYKDGKRTCVYWETFRGEARAAILAAYRWHKENRRWPMFCK